MSRGPGTPGRLRRPQEESDERLPTATNDLPTTSILTAENWRGGFIYWLPLSTSMASSDEQFVRRIDTTALPPVAEYLLLAASTLLLAAAASMVLIPV